jgi:hypothetical protein
MEARFILILAAACSMPSLAQESLVLQGGTSMAIQPGTVVSTTGKVAFGGENALMHLRGVLRLHRQQPDALPGPATGRGIRIADPAMQAALEWNMTGSALYRIPFVDSNAMPTTIQLYPGDVVPGPRWVRLSTYATAADNAPYPPQVTNVLGPLGQELAADMADRFWRLECTAPLYADLILQHTPQEAPANGSDELRITLWDGNQWSTADPGQDMLGTYQVQGTFNFQPGTPYTMAVGREEALASTIRLALRALLQGPLNPGTGLMNDALRSLPDFPLVEPNTDLGLEFGGGAAIDPGVLTVAGPDAIVDWVVVQLRSVSEPWIVEAGRAALLQRDGDVVDVDGFSPVAFSKPTGVYRIALLHRNHLGVLTASGVGLGTQPTTVDLGNGSVPTYGTDAMHVQNGHHALWAGNAVWDDRLKYVGSDNDRDLILLRIGGSVPTNTINGYWSEDVTLDGVVKYVGNGNDRDVILQNIGGIIPTAVRLEQLPW